MSFGWTALTWTAISVGVGAASTAYSAEATRKAGSQAAANATKTQQAADEANNRANAKRPDSAASLTAAMLASKGGNAGTMLTGPGGVDPNLLTLGKSSLLGGGG